MISPRPLAERMRSLRRFRLLRIAVLTLISVVAGLTTLRAVAPETWQAFRTQKGLDGFVILDDFDHDEDTRDSALKLSPEWIIRNGHASLAQRDTTTTTSGSVETSASITLKLLVLKNDYIRVRTQVAPSFPGRVSLTLSDDRRTTNIEARPTDSPTFFEVVHDGPNSTWTLRLVASVPASIGSNTDVEVLEWLSVAKGPHISHLSDVGRNVAIASSVPIFMWFLAITLGLPPFATWLWTILTTLVCCVGFVWVGIDGVDIAILLIMWSLFQMVSSDATNAKLPKLVSRLKLDAAALLIVAFGIMFRWSWLRDLAPYPLAPDAQFYWMIAWGVQHPYDTYSREPLFPLIARVMMEFMSPSPMALRGVTMLLSVLLMVLVYRVARRHLSPVTGFIALSLCAFNPLQASSAPMGLREELLPIILLMFVSSMWRMDLRPRLNDGSTGSIIAMSAASLVRLNALVSLLPIYLLVALRGRVGVVRIALGVVVPVLVLAPYLIYCHNKYGEAMYASDIHARFYRNAEFQGQPGHVTPKEFRRNAYAGEPVTTSHYLFGMRSMTDFTSATVVGATRIFVGDIASGGLFGPTTAPEKVGIDGSPKIVRSPDGTTFGWTLVGAFIFGAIALLRRRGGWIILATIFMFQMPLAFFAGKDLLSVRHLQNPLPLMQIVAAYGMVTFVVAIQQWWAWRRRPRLIAD